jgi:hypothetical protein
VSKKTLSPTPEIQTEPETGPAAAPGGVAVPPEPHPTGPALDLTQAPQDETKAQDDGPVDDSPVLEPDPAPLAVHVNTEGLPFWHPGLTRGQTLARGRHIIALMRQIDAVLRPLQGVRNPALGAIQQNLPGAIAQLKEELDLARSA